MDEQNNVLMLDHSALGEVQKLHQYGGAWAIRESDGTALLNRIREMDLSAHIAEERQAAASEPAKTTTGRSRYSVLDGGVAMISMAGVMTKYGSSMAMLREGTLGVRRALRQAAADKEVNSIILRIDSPGGSVSGTGDLAEDVARVKKKKPVYAYIEDLGASAAYYVASQATRVIANKDALVGSIGVYMVVDDWSGFFAREGVKTHVIKAGKFKGAGIQGTQITDEQLANWQREVDGVNENFVAAVARGRGMSKAQIMELADGRVHTANIAKTLGLIDEVGTIDEALAGATGKGTSFLTEAVAERPPSEFVAAEAAEKESDMSATGTDANAASNTTATAPAVSTPRVATLEELQSNFPNAGNDFYVACLGKKMTLDQANAAHVTKTDAEMAALRTENEKLKKTHGKNATGVDPVADGGVAVAAEDAVVDPITAWNIAVDKEMSVTKDRARAVANVVRKHPEIHKAYLAAVNERKAR